MFRFIVFGQLAMCKYREWACLKGAAEAAQANCANLVTVIWFECAKRNDLATGLLVQYCCLCFWVDNACNPTEVDEAGAGVRQHIRTGAGSLDGAGLEAILMMGSNKLFVMLLELQNDSTTKCPTNCRVC
jgi:hypothetical protein